MIDFDEPIGPDEVVSDKLETENDLALTRYINTQLAAGELFPEFGPWHIEGAEWKPESGFWTSLQRVLKRFRKKWKSIHVREQREPCFRSNYAFICFCEYERDLNEHERDNGWYVIDPPQE
jgi:hypothetical protein